LNIQDKFEKATLLMKLEDRLNKSLEQLKSKSALRSLKLTEGLIDFCSNDYLGLAVSAELSERVAQAFSTLKRAGSGGSRLLSGNHSLMEELESLLCNFHQSEAALLFNSGYDANLSIFGSVPRRGDLVLYDSLVHASIHDGMRIGKAELLAFRHNDSNDLKSLLESNKHREGQIFVAVESLYSMDGDLAPLSEIAEICQHFAAALIVDEAHATGVFGHNGVGRVQELGLQDKVFARLHTFGKAIGGHGAAILGSKTLREYLINFARPLIFSTAMSLHDVLHAKEAYLLLSEKGELLRSELHEKIQFYRSETVKINKKYPVLDSISPIQGIIIPGNESVMKMAQKLQEHALDIRPIRYPSVAAGTERLRICLHSYNSEEEIRELISLLARN
jgi:8-amino-7-oxononanoate synthase